MFRLTSQPCSCGTLVLSNLPVVFLSQDCIKSYENSTRHSTKQKQVTKIKAVENSDLGGCETLETPNIFLFPSVLSFITIFIWSWFILERFVLQVKVEVVLFNLESLFF